MRVGRGELLGGVLGGLRVSRPVLTRIRQEGICWLFGRGKSRSAQKD